MASNQGRQESPIDPEGGPLALFALELRQLRERCGRPTYRQLATWSAKVGSPYSDTTFSTAARGHTPPSREVVLAFVRACLAYARTGRQQTAHAVGEWTARWEALEAELNAGAVAQPPSDLFAPSEAAPSAPPPLRPVAREDQTAEPLEPPSATPAVPRTPSRRGKQVLATVVGLVALCGLVLVARHIAAPGSAVADSEYTVEASVATPPTSAGLGGNNRCGRPRYVDGVAWTPCTRADGARLVFAVQMTNTGPDPVTVKAKLAYVRAAVAHTCPGVWGRGVELTVAPGKTVTSPLAECTVAKLPATAFQAKAWVIASSDYAWGYREMSQTIHVQPDGRTALWADES
ncbi:hypothetical protein ACIP6V_14635 [Streptomyces sp. NPDC088770]|uniref:helix-turn-helix transcriptional regulator n=1 Tax=unclassified Streptomyces TaxID=2593676 RepID=UPI002DDC020A|nr:helix-turn-helix transcriptional regulator [Streptomyces sp. NBC_01788]WSB24884.1 helix-turn-helix domain-containing protein [Streptomyces sp. NBC_01788]